jgi:hypothetical protein
MTDSRYDLSLIEERANELQNLVVDAQKVGVDLSPGSTMAS